MADMSRSTKRKELNMQFNNMYSTLENGANIALENTKEERAEAIMQARAKKRHSNNYGYGYFLDNLKGKKGQSS